jgi:hypothetical protein
MHASKASAEGGAAALHGRPYDGTRHGLRVHHGLVLALCLIALAATAHGLWRGAQYRAGLDALHGNATYLVLAALAIGVALGLTATVTRLKAWRAGRWTETSLQPFRLLFIALVLGWIAYVALRPTYQELLFELTLGVALSAFAGGVVLQAVDGRSSKVLRSVDFILFNVCVIAFALELGLRVYADVRPNLFLVRPNAKAATNLEARRKPPGWIYLGHPHNQRGYYDEEFGPKEPGERRVVSISDSFGLGTVPLRYHYTSVAEDLLDDVRVDNMGVPGIGLPDYLHLLQTEANPLNPEMVVLWIFVGNDLEGLQRYKAPDSGVESWFKRKNLLALTVLERRAALAAENQRMKDGQETEVAQDETRVITEEDELAQTFPWILGPELETSKAWNSAENFFSVETQRAKSLAGPLPKTDPYPEFFEILSEIRRNARGSKFAVILIPDSFQVEDDVWEVVQERLGVDLDRDRPQRRIGEWLNAEGVAYIDLLPRLRELPRDQDGARHAYHFQNTHFNRLGNRIAGEALAELVREKL